MRAAAVILMIVAAYLVGYARGRWTRATATPVPEEAKADAPQCPRCTHTLALFASCPLGLDLRGSCPSFRRI